MELKKYRILLLDTKRSNPNHYICLGLEYALKRNDRVECVIHADLYDAVSLAKKNKCNIFLAFDGEELNLLLCKKISEVCGTSILWVTEDPYEINTNIKNSEIFDIVYTNDSGSVAKYGGKAKHLPLAAISEFHFHPVIGDLEKLKYDIYFAGTAWPNRVNLIKEIIDSKKLQSLNYRFNLPTNVHLPVFSLGLSESELDKRVAPLDFSRLSNSSLATLILPRVFGLNGGGFAETPPPRLFECALSGTTLVVQSNISEVSNYFEEGSEYLKFTNAKDLESIIDYLKNNIDQRNLMAEKGQRKALNYHLYDHRVKIIINDLDNKSEFEKYNTLKIDNKKRKNILFLIHNSSKNGSFGGVEAYIEKISPYLVKDFNIYFYVPVSPGNYACSILYDQSLNPIKKYEFKSICSSNDLSNSERESIFYNILDSLDIEVVHFHHLIGHVPSYIAVANSLGLRTVFTFHDYYSVCSNFNLISFKGVYCFPNKINIAQCDLCLEHSSKIQKGSQACRRTYWNKLLHLVDTLIFNTEGADKLASDIYPSVLLHNDKRIIPVPTEVNLNKSSVEMMAINKIKVAIIGNFLFHKGGCNISRVIGYLASNNNFEFHIFGDTHGNYEYLKNNEQLPNVYYYGGFSPGKFPDQIYSCNVSLHLSIWPETYCLTLSEAWLLGMIPIVSDIGALGERVHHGVNGLKVEVNSEGGLIDALNTLLYDKDLFIRIKDNINGIEIPNVNEHISKLTDIYQYSEVVSIKSKFPVNSFDSINLRNFNFIIPEKWAIINSEKILPAHDLGDINSKIEYHHARNIKKFFRYAKNHGLRSALQVVRSKIREKL